MQFQPGEGPENALPFTIGKVLVQSDMRPEDVRGNHAHYETEEIVVALRGGCTFDLDDGKGTHETLRLTDANWPAAEEDNPSSATVRRALLLYPHVWRVFREFEPGTILMVVADRLYDEKDYIRDRLVFEREAGGWRGLGGSAERGDDERRA
ncbi:MAG: FdtA/QdtA family cupin domain-containing protein [Kiritimatiellae bacterium]|nr:FdtA/QdtA family cupin domain-containing protein [Kiritimatiellia bacterium]